MGWKNHNDGGWDYVPQSAPEKEMTAAEQEAAYDKHLAMMARVDESEGLCGSEDLPKAPCGPAEELAEVRRLMGVHAARPDTMNALRTMETRILASMAKKE